MPEDNNFLDRCQYTEWAVKARESASLRLQHYGLPKYGDEYWKFTNPALLNESANQELADSAKLVAHEYHPKIPNGPISGSPTGLSVSQPHVTNGNLKTELSTFPDTIKRSKIVFLDGQATGLDDLETQLKDLDVCTLNTAFQDKSSWVKNIFGQLESKSHANVPRSLATYNTQITNSGICIRANDKSAHPVELRYENYMNGWNSVIHHVIYVAPNASLTLIESGQGSPCINKTIEVKIDEGGEFHHIQIQDHVNVSASVSYIFAEIEKDASFKSLTVTSEGQLTRNECIVYLCGDEGKAHIAGAAVGGRGFHHDDTVYVVHDAFNCESRQIFKKVLLDDAIGVFQGKILVQRNAQKTDGYQLSQALLLADNCQFLAKPELEIYADDVVCSHGSTCGSIDPDAFFYMLSRGISKNQAKEMLSLAFLNETLEEIDDKQLAEALQNQLQIWLNRSQR